MAVAEAPKLLLGRHLPLDLVGAEVSRMESSGMEWTRRRAGGMGRPVPRADQAGRVFRRSRMSVL